MKVWLRMLSISLGISLIVFFTCSKNFLYESDCLLGGNILLFSNNWTVVFTALTRNMSRISFCPVPLTLPLMCILTYLSLFLSMYFPPGLPWWLRQSRICLQCRRPGFDPWVRKISREGTGNPLQYSCLENTTDRGAWQATVCGVAKSWTRLRD